MKLRTLVFFQVLFVFVFSSENAFSQGTETISEPYKKLYGHEKDVSSLAVSPNGKYLAAGSWQNRVIVWNMDSGFKQVWKFRAHESTVEGMDFSHDSKYFATCSDDTKAKIWNVDSQSLSLTLGAHTSTVNDVVFNDHYKGNKGRFVATATSRGVVRVFDRERKGKILRKIEIKNTSANALAFGPNGKYVIVGCGDNVIRIYNFLNGELSRKFEGHKDEINALELSPDGMHLASGSSDKTAKIWSYGKGEVLHNLKGHTWRVLSINYSSNGDYVVTGSNDGTARLWNASTGEELKVFRPERRDYIRAIAMSPDGRFLITASLVRKPKDAGVLIWETGLESSNK